MNTFATYDHREKSLEIIWNNWKIKLSLSQESIALTFNLSME